MLDNPDAAAIEPPAHMHAPKAASRQSAGEFVRILHNGKAVVGIIILSIFAILAIFGPWIAPGDPTAFVALPNQPPSPEHWLGTTGQGQDVYTQLVRGTRPSLAIGLLVGIVATMTGTAIGMMAAFLGGRWDDSLSTTMNIFLVIPGLPLLVVLAAFLPRGPATIVLVLAFTGWAGTARVMRSQTLSLREKDFVSAAVVSGENSFRTTFVEILPHMASIVASALFGAIIYGIAAQAGLEFLGLGDVSSVSWGTILYWAGNNAGLLTGAWWTFVPAGLCIALVAFALAMLNYAVDEITNPRLRSTKEAEDIYAQYKQGRATPVIRGR